MKLPSQSHTASEGQDQDSNLNLFRFFSLHPRPSPPECLSQFPKALFGLYRMENFQSVFRWPARTGALAWLRGRCVPRRFIEKVESIPTSQPHPDPGFLKWRQRLTGGSASWQFGGVGRALGPPGETPGLAVTFGHKQWLAMQFAPTLPLGYRPQSLLGAPIQACSTGHSTRAECAVTCF